MILGYNHTSFTVSDLEQTIAFYRDVLGLEFVTQFESVGGHTVGYPNAHLKVALFRMGDSRLEFIEYLNPRGEKLDLETKNTGCAHMAFTVDDVQALYEKLRAQGVRFAAAPHRGRSGRTSCYARDPDGITFELIDGPPSPPQDA